MRLTILHAAIACLLVLTEQAAPQPMPVTGTAIDVDINGRIYVLDNRASTLRQYAPDGRLLREIGGQGWGNDQFDRPAGLWAKNGLDIFVADFGNHRIQRFDKNLAFVSSFSTRNNDNPDERFGYPLDVSLSRLGELYVCDSENERIVKVGPANTVERTFGGYGAGPGRLYRPVMVKCGPEDNVYVLDPPRLMIFDTFGNALGELAPPSLPHPLCIAADQNGLAVLDSARVLYFEGPAHHETSIPLSSLGPAAGDASSCAVSGRTLYLLGPSGLLTVPLSSSGRH